MSIAGKQDGNATKPIALVRHEGQQFRFTHDDPADHLFSILQRTGAFYECEMLQALAPLLHPKDLVLDVGANIGTHTVFFAGACECSVIAFEPNPRAVGILRSNVELNGLQERVEIEPVAVGAAPQRGILIEPAAHNLGTSSTRLDPNGDVGIVSIDSMSISGKVALIKVDIEGNDAEAVKGACKLLSRDHPVIVIEAKTVAEYAEIARLLDPLGYVAAGSFNYSPTHLFVRPPAGSSKGRLVPQLSHRLALQYIDSMSRRISIDQRFARLSAQLADIDSKSHANQEHFLAQSDELKCGLDAFGTMLSTLVESLQDQGRILEAQFAPLLERAAASDVGAKQLRAEIQTRFQNLSDSVHLSTATLAESLASLRQEVSEHISRQAAENDKAIVRLERSLNALDRKGDAAIETTLLVAASFEAELERLRRDLLGSIHQQISSHVGTVTAQQLGQLKAELAKSVGRQFGELRVDLDALLGKGDMSFEDALASFGINRNSVPTQKAKDNQAVDFEVSVRSENAPWYVRHTPTTSSVPSSHAPRRSDELLAQFDFDQGWKDQAWGQQGTELKPQSLVVAIQATANLGFVTRLIDCVGGGLLEVEIRTITSGGAPTGRILRIMSDAGEAIGHDFSLNEGQTRIRAFAPLRTKRIKLHVLKLESPLDAAFRVPTLTVKRIHADGHQVEVSARIGKPVFASLASIPSRREMLRDCVNSLLVQCDTVRVFLNEYPDVPPFLGHSRVEVRRSQDWDDRGDAGKFFWIDRDEGRSGYRLVVDDDLIFPPDFAETMTKKVAALDNKAIYTAHGILLRQPICNYYETSSRASTFHFGHGLQVDRAVHIGATNAMCFHTDAIRMRWADFKYRNSADIWLSLYAQGQKLPLLTPARPKNWIRENRHPEPNETIYKHSLRRTRSRFDSSFVQNAVIRHSSPLTLQVRDRIKCSFSLYATNVEDLKLAVRAWLSWRRLDVEWVVILIYDKEEAGIEAAIRSLEIPHEVHLIEAGHKLFSRIAALWHRVGVEAAFCASDAVRFSHPEREDVRSAVLCHSHMAPLEPLHAGPLISHKSLAIRSFRGARSELAQAFALGVNEYRLSWLTNMVSGAVVGRARSPFDVPFLLDDDDDTLPAHGPKLVTGENTTVRLNDFFERVLVLNLDRRQDRWQTVSRQLARLDIHCERISAIDGLSPEMAADYDAYCSLPIATISSDVPPVRYESELYLRYASQRARVAYIEGNARRKAITSAGAWGYLRSYEGILRQALEEQTESLLVFDDDVVLHKQFQTIFSEAMKQLPSDWLIVQLGTLQYNWSEPWIQWRSSRLYQTNGSAVGSHAVGMRFDIYPFLLDQVSRMDLPYDVGALSAATRAFPDRCFVIYPNLAIQRLADSDIGTSEFQKGRSFTEMARTYRWNLNDYE